MMMGTLIYDLPIMRADAELVLSGSSESSLDRADLGDLNGDDEEAWADFSTAAAVAPYNSSKISSAIVFFLAAAAAAAAAASATAFAFGFSATAATSS